MTVHNATSSAEFTTALAAAVGGDSIVLAPGFYTSTYTVSKAYASEVIVESLDWSNPAEVFRINPRSTNLTLLNLKFAGAPVGDAFAVDGVGADNLKILNCEFDGYEIGIKCLECDNLEISRNNIYNWSNDGMQIVRSSDALVDQNWIHGANVISTGHSDGIQTFQVNTPSATPAVRYTYRRNFIECGPDRLTQSIFMANEKWDATGLDADRYVDILIEDNVIYNRHIHGISVGSTEGLIIQRNTLLTNLAVPVGGGGTGTPQINRFGAFGAVTVVDNVATLSSSEPHWIVSNNVPANPDDWISLSDAARAAISPLVGPQPVGAPGNVAPTASFTFNTTDLTANFTDTSTDSDGFVTGWSWDFDDASGLDTTQNPSHLYAIAGAYNVALTATDNDGGTDVDIQAVTVTAPPEAAFTFFATGLSVDFTDTSTDSDGTIVSWAWDFDDAVGTSTSQNPTYVYAGDGTYNVSLTATDNDSNFDTVIIPVTVAALNIAPTAGFTFNTVDNVANFTNTSTDSDGTIVSRSWDFGDGTALSTAINPRHRYAAAGTYNVELTVTDDDTDTDNIIKAVTVTDPPLPAPEAPRLYAVGYQL